MSFMNLSHIVYILPVLVLFIFFYLRAERRYFEWVEDHWFYKKSFTAWLSGFFFIGGIVLISLGLLDLRGYEKHIKGKVTNQKTIILIDTSASMLAEDVRPNRFQKSLLLTKHYVKKSVGQQISLVVFSDNQKRIIPFTDDVDLVNARIERLETLELARGGTGLAQAIQESVQYFKNTSSDLTGNILIFTDAEETELNFELKVPDRVSVALVGIGTAKGAPIPIRRNGGYSGNKKYKGEVVITKLDEKNISKIGSQVKYFHSWIATSYSLPTEEIVNFFNKENAVKQSENDVRIRPILTNYLLVPGVVLLILSTLLRFFKSYSPVIMILLLSFHQYGFSQEKKERKKSEQTLQLEGALLGNELDEKGKKALAASLLQDGFTKEAEILYGEVLKNEKINDRNLKDFSNLAAAKIQNGKLGEGFEESKKILDLMKKNGKANNKEVEKVLKQNILKALESGAGGGKGSKSEKSEEKENKNNKKQKSDEGNGEKSDSSSDSKDKSKDKESGQDKDKKDKKKENKSDGDDKKEKEKKEKQKQKESSGKPSDKISKKKLPAILKQLIHDDNQLQKKVIDAKTVERKSRERKDW